MIDLKFRQMAVTCLIATAGLTPLRAAETPLMKIGLITDTHVTRFSNSCKLLKKGFEVFKEQQAEMVVHCGDLADYSEEKAYENYRKTWKKVFPDAVPRQLFLYANHDDIVRGGGRGKLPRMKEMLQGNDYYMSFKHKGYNFILVPQLGLDMTRYENMVKAAVADTPDKPVFVFDHVPAQDTTCDSQVWGRKASREMLNKYPNVILISGHTHNSLRNELCIWQNEFTAVDVGCIDTWRGSLTGSVPPSKQAAAVIMMEVYPERVVFRRFMLPEKKELRPEKPWSVPLPFVRESAPYRLAVRSAASPAPEFAPGSAIQFQPDSPFTLLNMTFPEAQHPERTYKYRLELARLDNGNKLENFARQDLYGDFHLSEKQRTGKQQIQLSAGYFETGKKYRVIVTPQNFYGRCGKPLTAEFTAPEKSPTNVVYETNNPMKDCPFKSGLRGGKPLAKEDGWYIHDIRNARLEFPKKIWEGDAGSRFRFTVDMRMVQGDVFTWTVVLRNPQTGKNANIRVSTPPGESGLQRLVIEFVKKKAEHNYCLLIREGGKGKILFEHVKVEKLK